MSDQATESDEWLGESNPTALKLSMGFINKMEMLIDLCTFVEDRVFETDNKKKSDESEEDEDEEEGEAKSDGDMNFDILEEEWDNEDNKIINEDEVNEVKNQILMNNLQAFRIPLKIIAAASLDNADSTVSYLRVLEKCYIFLLKFVRNNRINQTVMLPKIDDFFKDFDYGVHAWELIAEIFRNTDQLVTYNLVPLLKRALRNISALELETHKKTIQLSFVNYFIFNKGEALPENQCLICAEVT